MHDVMRTSTIIVAVIEKYYNLLEETLKERNLMNTPSVCCVCMLSYDDDVILGVGVEWIQCACLRWLHY